MLRCSLLSLRHHSPSIPIDIYLIRDNCSNSRDIGSLPTTIASAPKVTTNMMSGMCASLGANLIDLGNFDFGSESGYAYAHRAAFAFAPNDKTLLMDADTFVFRDLSPMFDLLNGIDFIADKNMFGERTLLEYRGKQIRPFNSGVVLWGEGLLREYGKSVHSLCCDLRDGKHSLSDWLYKNSSTNPPLGREELACSIFVIDQGLRYRYFAKSEVQTENYLGGCAIYHTLTHNWPNSYFRFRGIEQYFYKKNIKRLVISSKRSFT